MLRKVMIFILAPCLATALRREQYPNETDQQYYDIMINEEPCFYLEKSGSNGLRFESSRPVVKNGEPHSIPVPVIGLWIYAETLYEEQIVSIALLWTNTLEQAAAALLRATLLAAGYDQDFIELYKRDSFIPSAENKYALTVELPAKNKLFLQARFTPDAMPLAICIRTSEWILMETWEISLGILHKCGWLVEGSKQSEQYINIYVVHKWNNTCDAEKIRRIAASSAQRIRILYLELSELADLIHNSNRSFLFLDNYNKNYKLTKAWPVELQNNPKQSEVVSNNMNCISTEVNKIVLLKYAVGKNIGDEVSERFVKFLPSISDLSNIIIHGKLKSQAYSDENDDNIKKAACRWALRLGSKLNFPTWKESAVLDTEKLRVAIFICKTEAQDLKEYVSMIKLFADYNNLTDSTFFNEDKILLQTLFIECANTNWITKKLTDWYQTNVIKTSLEHTVIGMILPSEVAIAAAPFATRVRVPLFTYDIYSGRSYETLRSATGSVEHLVLALLRLLAICGWQRLGIISEPTQLAEKVSAALRAPTTLLTVRDLNIKTTLDIPSALQVLINADTRVLLVNTGAATAAAVLAAARELGITRDKGFVWIVREYDAADHATAATRPYSVSFWWRGERENEMITTKEKSDKSDHESEANEKELTDLMIIRLKLQEKWQGRAWPLHAAPLLDALITLLALTRNSNWDHWLFRYWNIMDLNTKGIKQHLTYDDVGVISPLIFVEQWATEPRPRLLATWRGGDNYKSGEACPINDPPSDGSTHCFLPSGDPFQPSCRERLWITILTTIIGLTILAIVAIYWSRKAFLAHNLRIKTEYAKRMLARRERTFEALAEHLVDRKMLDLLQEMGKGRFGRVYQGLLRESSSKGRTVVVAAKVLREDASSAEESEFLREACTLATLDHEHIIRFVGVCVVDGPPLLLMEHAFFGDLLQYLQARRCLVENTTNTETTKCFETDEKTHVSAKAITKLAHEAAMALAYLAQLGIVHRDVRASNCLVDERRCLKLADFGLARATGTVDGEYQMCRKGVLPVLWMAPESLAKGMFSPASDVWSFGVLVFELVTLGRRPYGVQPPPVVLRHVVAGGRPQLPWDASAETQALTRSCWRREPEARPTAARIADWLSTPCRMLRPALVAELVEIDKLLNDNDLNEPYLSPPETTPSEPLRTQLSSQSEQIVMKEINQKS